MTTPASTPLALATPAEVAALTNKPAVPPNTIDVRWATGGVGNMAANRTAFARVQGSPLRISRLAVSVGTASGNIALAVYNNVGSGTNARPDQRLATTGSVVCPATGEAILSLDVAVDVKPGDWFALGCDNATATFNRNQCVTMATAGMAYACQQNTAFPPPATVGTLAAPASVFMILGLE